MSPFVRVRASVLGFSLFLTAAAGSAGAQTVPPAGAGAGAKPATNVNVPAEAKRLESAFIAAAERASTSIVQLDILGRDDVEGRFSRWVGRQGDSPLVRSIGTGVVFTTDGAIITNNHLVEDALSINVRLADGRTLPAKLLGRDPPTDLAVLKVETSGLPAARFVETDNTKPGQWVVAVGASFGQGANVSAGVVSAKGRGSLGVQAIDDFMQTSAAITPANTGGPICDLEGRALGVSSSVIGRGSGIGLAAPAALVRRVAEQIMKTGRVERAWLGAGLQDLTPDLAAAMKQDARAGVIITSVADGGPAKKANLIPGDIVASVAGVAVRDPAELQREIYAKTSGQSVVLEVVRGTQRYRTELTLATQPAPQLPPVPVQQQGVPQVGLGFNARDMSRDESVRLGFAGKTIPIVTVVVPGSPAERAGLRVGDVILEADGTADATTQQLVQASQDGSVLVRVRRHDQAFFGLIRK